MSEAMQMAQDAQAGHACDYCTKLQPTAFNEVKEEDESKATLVALSVMIIVGFIALAVINLFI